MNIPDQLPKLLPFLYSIITKEFVSLSKHNVSILNSPILNSELTKSISNNVSAFLSLSLKGF